jgi:hypothetical protein
VQLGGRRYSVLATVGVLQATYWFQASINGKGVPTFFTASFS